MNKPINIPSTMIPTFNTVMVNFRDAFEHLEENVCKKISCEDCPYASTTEDDTNKCDKNKLLPIIKHICEKVY